MQSKDFFDTRASCFKRLLNVVTNPRDAERQSCENMAGFSLCKLSFADKVPSEGKASRAAP